MNGPHDGIFYQQFLKSLVEQRQAQTYLEIGVQNGLNLAGISVPTAFGVDPELSLTVDPSQLKSVTHLFRMTSDAFFRSQNKTLTSYGGIDFAFLDGLHLFEFLLRDFYNTEKNSSHASLITMHDCLPFDGEMIERVYAPENRTPESHVGAWTGDVWKVILILERYRPDLSVVLVDCAPTGLVCVTGLNPKSTVLEDAYLDIVSEYLSTPNDIDAIVEFYSTHKIIKSSDIIKDNRQSGYFRV